MTDDADDVTAVASGSAAVVRVLEVDPGLAESLDAEQLANAVPRSIARTATVAQGPWWYEPPPDQEPGMLGLLVLEGVLLRELTVDACTRSSSSGPATSSAPWTYEGDSAPVTAKATWQVIEPLRIALLDRRFALRMAPWPEISAALLDREAERTCSAIVELAVRQRCGSRTGCCSPSGTSPTAGDGCPRAAPCWG